MADPRIEELAGKVLEAISDPKVCGYGADALRNAIKRELRNAASNRNPRTNEAIDHASRRIAGRVEDVCRGLPPGVRAIGTVVAAAGAIYGVSQMPEEEIRAAIAKIEVDVIDTRLMIAGQRVDMSVSTTLAPLFGDDPSVDAEAKWKQELFGQRGNARLYARDLGGDEVYGGSWSTRYDRGTAEFGANSRDGGTVYFRLKIDF